MEESVKCTYGLGTRALHSSSLISWNCDGNIAAMQEFLQMLSSF